jgi:hypothetical protein
MYRHLQAVWRVCRCAGVPVCRPLLLYKLHNLLGNFGLCDLPDLICLDFLASMETFNSVLQEKTNELNFTEQRFNFRISDVPRATCHSATVHICKAVLDIPQPRCYRQYSVQRKVTWSLRKPHSLMCTKTQLIFITFLCGCSIIMWAICRAMCRLSTYAVCKVAVRTAQ